MQMSIKLPEHCKGMTAGALRQLQQHGYTTASGGGFSKSFVDHAFIGDQHLYTSKREPVGGYMSNLETAKQHVEEMSEAMSKATRNMVHTADAATKELAAVSGRLRDATDKLGSAIVKFNAATANKSFAESADRATKLVEAMERLAVLQERGVLDKVIKALQ
jgi:hypothetical protein